MKPKQFLSLLVVPLFYLGLTCFVPKKAEAEIIQTALGNMPIACDTNTQKCYTPQNGRWAYVGTINDVSTHQYNAKMCMDAYYGNSTAALMTRGIDCSSYGIPQNRAAQQQWNRLQDRLLDLAN